MLKIVKKIFIYLLLFLLPLILYIITAHLLTYFPKKYEKIANQDETVYISYSKLHSDIIIKIDSLGKRWKKRLPPHILRHHGFLSFGWGDKEFYLNTPTWSELKVSSALKALFINTPSVIHVTHLNHIEYFENIKKIQLSQRQLQHLEESIFKSFDFNTSHYKGYGRDDIFYSSPYPYNIFTTCNTWTGRELREANITVSYWTPFAYNVIDSLP